MRARPALLVLAVLAASCRKGEDPGHGRYLEARRAYGAVLADTRDESCPVEPACAELVAALSGLPDGHPDAVEARKVLDRIARARAAKGSDEVPGFLRGAEPRLPAPDEVPGFLNERIGAPAGADVGVGAGAGAEAAGPGAPPGAGTGAIAGSPPPDAPSTARPPVESEPDAGATVIAVGDGADEEPGTAADAATGDDERPAPPAVAPAGGGERPATVGDRAPAPLDPCAAIRDRLAQRKDWLARTAAERNTIAHVADEKDHAALLQLRQLHRCQEHPDDPDCRAPPLEADVDRLTVDLRDVTREPDELVAEGKDPDDLPHDPVVRDLEARLRACDAGR